MLSELTNLQSINITILPVIIIPVTGLCCLVFYNRLSALNLLIHNITKSLLNLYVSPPATITEKQKEEIKKTYWLEQEKLLHRSNLVRRSIVSCFIGIIAFILSAISIILGIYWPNIVIATLTLWVIGAISFAVGLLTGIFEMKASTLQNITMMLALMKGWESEAKNSSL